MPIRHRPRLIISAAAGTAQMVIVSTTGLIIYGYMIRTLGAEAVGGWLAVMALGMIACIADLGLREALVRRTAVAAADDDPARLGETVATLVLTMAGSMALSLFLALGPWPWTLASLGPHAALLGRHGPVIACIIWLQRMADMSSAVLEGLQRFDLTARSNTLASGVGLATALLLIPVLGLSGTECALASQYGTLLVCNLFTLRTHLRGTPRSSWRWRWPVLRASLPYGLSVQGMVASVLLVENLAKLLLGRMGETALLSYFDFAFRVTRGVRNFLVAGNRVLVPRIAEKVQEGEDHNQLYRMSFAVLAALSVPAFAIIGGMSGLISVLLTGGWVSPCVFTLLALSLTWLVFCLMDPAFNMQLGTARLKSPLQGHLLMPALALLIASPMARLWGGEGVVAAVGLSIIVGCTVVVIRYHKAQHLALRELAPYRTLFLLASGAAGSWLGLTLSRDLLARGWPSWQWGALALIAAALAPALPALLRLRDTPLGRFIPTLRKK